MVSAKTMSSLQKRKLRKCCLSLGALLSLAAFACLFLYDPQTLNMRPLWQVVKPRSVYFLETSGRPNLDLRQLAAVESAAFFHSNTSIKVLIFSENETVLTPAMDELAKEYDITFTRASMRDLSRGSPLQDWYKKAQWMISPHKVAHLSDAFRLLVVWMYGGLYLDLDVLFTRTWTFPNNVLIYERDKVFFVNGIFGFESRHPFLSDCLDEIAEHYNPNEWVANGPLLLTRVYNRLNGTLKAGIQTLPKSSFFEIYYNEHRKLFETKYLQEVLKRTAKSFGVHVWNKMNANERLNASVDNAYMHIVKNSSPKVYKHMLAAGVV